MTTLQQHAPRVDCGITLRIGRDEFAALVRTGHARPTTVDLTHVITGDHVTVTRERSGSLCTCPDFRPIAPCPHVRALEETAILPAPVRAYRATPHTTDAETFDRFPSGPLFSELPADLKHFPHTADRFPTPEPDAPEWFDEYEMGQPCPAYEPTHERRRRIEAAAPPVTDADAFPDDDDCPF
jgi:hypothetical protein